jgi:outer membrane protein TolC
VSALRVAAKSTPENQAAGIAVNGASADSSFEELRKDAAPQNRAQFAPGHRYSLAELIDIAERHHPETRQAWEKARQAALSVGIAESSYLPQLSANAIAGYQITPFPAPQNVVPAGFITFTTVEVVPVAAASWLLFDFGQREAKVQDAEAKSFVANVSFTEAHEKIVFDVSRDYFALGSARAKVRVAEYAVENAKRTQDISEARNAQGIATVVEVAQSRRQTAQAQYDLVKARGGERTAYSALLASIGIDVDGTIDVADSSDRPLPAAPILGVRALVEKALASRPDVLAALGKVRAAEAGLGQAKGAYWPTIKIESQVYGFIGKWSVGQGFFNLTQPGFNALLKLDWPLFDGGARVAKVDVARSQISEARAALDGVRDRAAVEVTRAYDQLQASFAEYQAAMAVDDAGRTALDAAIGSYRTGVGPLTDVLTTSNAASESRMEKETARANVFTSAAALAFALGAATRK